MAIISYFILTEAEKDAAEALNAEAPEGVRVECRMMDNPLGNNLGLGILVGKYILPARLLNDPDFSLWHDMFSQWPINMLDTEIVFLPAEEI